MKRARGRISHRGAEWLDVGQQSVERRDRDGRDPEQRHFRAETAASGRQSDPGRHAREQQQDQQALGERTSRQRPEVDA